MGWCVKLSPVPLGPDTVTMRVVWALPWLSPALLPGSGLSPVYLPPAGRLPGGPPPTSSCLPGAPSAGSWIPRSAGGHERLPSSPEPSASHSGALAPRQGAVRGWAVGTGLGLSVCWVVVPSPLVALYGHDPVTLSRTRAPRSQHPAWCPRPGSWWALLLPHRHLLGGRHLIVEALSCVPRAPLGSLRLSQEEQGGEEGSRHKGPLPPGRRGPGWRGCR